MHNSQSCGHLTCAFKLKFGPYANLSVLVAIGFLGLLAAIGLKTCSGFTETNDVKNAALEFAKDFKSAEETARQTRHVLSIQISPGPSFNSPFKYRLFDGQEMIQEKALPTQISGTGHAKLDPDGVPMLPTTFQFRKGAHTVKVTIDARGDISFPTE
jgi:type II secretory pathway pseudopilin PulG